MGFCWLLVENSGVVGHQKRSFLSAEDGGGGDISRAEGAILRPSHLRSRHDDEVHYGITPSALTAPNIAASVGFSYFSRSPANSTMLLFMGRSRMHSSLEPPPALIVR